MRADVRLRELADKGLRLVTRQQLLAAGLSDAQIKTRIRQRLLDVVHAGVYLVGGGAPTFEQRALAACLACGVGSFVSHFSAGHLWGFIESAPATVSVTVDRSKRPRDPSIDIHRSRSTGRGEQT
jgi:predicted transcriptional regulator of viral defense system